MKFGSLIKKIKREMKIDNLMPVFYIGLPILFVYALSSDKTSIYILFVVVFIISYLLHQINEELKRKKLKPTRKNIINQTKFKLFEFFIGALILALVIYLINLWYGFIFIFLIGGFFYTFTKSFREK